MSIRPLDYQITVPKAVDVSRLQSDQVQRTLTSQQVQVAHSQYKADEKQRIVQKREKPEHVTIHEKQKQSNQEQKDRNREQQRREHSKSNKKLNKNLNSATPGSKIDIIL